MDSKNFILSQKFRYLGFGAIIGFIFALNESPLDYYLLIGFVVLTIILEWWIKRRK